jgi:hypothetical protein
MGLAAGALSPPKVALQIRGVPPRACEKTSNRAIGYVDQRWLTERSVSVAGTTILTLLLYAAVALSYKDYPNWLSGFGYGVFLPRPLPARRAGSWPKVC